MKKQIGLFCVFIFIAVYGTVIGSSNSSFLTINQDTEANVAQNKSTLAVAADVTNFTFSSEETSSASLLSGKGKSLQVLFYATGFSLLISKLHEAKGYLRFSEVIVLTFGIKQIIFPFHYFW